MARSSVPNHIVCIAPNFLAATGVALTLCVAGLPAVSYAGNSTGTQDESPEAAPVEGPAPAPAPAPAQPQPVSEPPGKGVGLIVGGSVIVGTVGIPFTAWGALTLVAASACKDANNSVTMDGFVDASCNLTRNLGIGLLVPGLLGLIGGGVMIGFGARNLSRYKQWKAQNGIAFAPTFGTTRHRTPTYGFVLRF